MPSTERAEHKAVRQCFKIFKLLSSLNEEYAALRSKALTEPTYFSEAVIQFSKRLIRVKRLIKGFIATHEVSPILDFNLDENTVTLGFRGASRHLIPMKALKIHPTLLREILDGMPKPSEITAMVDRRIRLIVEKEEQRLPCLSSKLDRQRPRADQNERELLSPAEASRMLGVSYKTLWRWWKEGKIRAVRLPSKRLRYYRDEIEQLLHKEA